MRVKTTARKKPQKPRRPMPQEMKLQFFGKCDCGNYDCVNSLLRSHDVAGYIIGHGRGHGHLSTWLSQN